MYQNSIVVGMSKRILESISRATSSPGAQLETGPARPMMLDEGPIVASIFRDGTLLGKVRDWRSEAIRVESVRV